MGAAATKHFQPDKARDAAIVLEAVQAYERAHPGEVPSDNHSFQAHLFKRRVLLAVEDSKRRGRDVDQSFQQLSDQDLAELYKYIESSREKNKKDSSSTAGNAHTHNDTQGSLGDSHAHTTGSSHTDSDTHTPTHTQTHTLSRAHSRHAMAVEEFDNDNDSDNENDNENENGVDETTSVLSYGDDREDSETDAAALSVALAERDREKDKERDKHTDRERDREREREVVEDLEATVDRETDTERERHAQQRERSRDRERDRERGAALIFPSDSAAVVVPSSPAVGSAHKATINNNNNNNSSAVGSASKSKEERIAHALAKFWEIDEDLQTAENSPFISHKEFPSSTRSHPHSATHSDRNNNNNNNNNAQSYRERGQRIDERNERLIGLQRQKVMSFTQNAQLEREVEALQKQLEQMEELEKSTASLLAHSHYGSSHYGTQYSSHSTQTGSGQYGTHSSHQASSSHSHSQFPRSSIFPIDEEDCVESSSKQQSERERERVRVRVSERRPAAAAAKMNSSSESESDPLAVSYGTLNSARDRVYEQERERDRERRHVLSDDSKQNSPIIQRSEAKERERERERERTRDALLAGEDVEKPPRHVVRPRRRRSLCQGTASDASDSDSAAPYSSRRGTGLSVASTSSSVAPTHAPGVAGVSVVGYAPSMGAIKRQSSDRAPSSSALNTHTNESATVSKKSGTESRRARNTIANNEESNPRAKDSDVEKDSIASVERKLVRQMSKRRHSLDTVPSPIKEFPPAKERDTVLDRVVDKLLSPREKNINNKANNVLSPRPRPELRRDATRSTDREDSNKKNVLKDDQFEALFAGNAPAPDQSNAKINKAGDVALPPKRHRIKKPVVEEKSHIQENTRDDEPWSPLLDQQWAEVSLLLRQPIKSEESMLYAAASAEAGIMFTDQMNSIAKSLNVLRGQLSRWILPYDSNTRIETQCSTPHSVVENMPDEFRGKLTERQVHYLVAGANGVRKLVRVKIADDNDLEQARRALETTNTFFKNLYERANKLNMSPFELLQKSSCL